MIIATAPCRNAAGRFAVPTRMKYRLGDLVISVPIASRGLDCCDKMLRTAASFDSLCCFLSPLTQAHFVSTIPSRPAPGLALFVF